MPKLRDKLQLGNLVSHLRDNFEEHIQNVSGNADNRNPHVSDIFISSGKSTKYYIIQKIIWIKKC